MASHDLSVKTTLPAAPATQRATPVRIDVFQDTVAYGSGNCVIVRRLSSDGSDPARDAVLVCSLHKAAVTAVRFSPNGAFVASGDQSGCVVLFANKAGTLEKLNVPALQGPVRDIAWTGDGERLIVVGEGKKMFGVAISNTGNSIGAINGHTRHIMACDMRHDRPFRAFTGGADSFVGFYEGVPFTFKTNTQGHTGTVNGVRYCPAVNEVATCSSSADIVIFDGTTGAEKRKLPSAHSGTVYALCWSPNGELIATASADKRVHILNAADGAVRHRINLGPDVTDMQQGIVWTATLGVVAVSLRGSLTTIDPSDGKVRGVQVGHQGRILFLHGCRGTGDLLSLSAEGKLIRWWADASWTRNSLIPLPSAADVVNCATVRGDRLYMVAGNQVLTLDTADATPGAEVTVLSPDAGGFAAAIAVTQGGKIVLVSRSKLVVLDSSGNKCAEESLPPSFNATTAAAARGNGADLVVVGGERVVKVFQVDAAGKVKATAVEFKDRHTGTVSSVAANATGDRVCSADGTSRSIFVWSPVTGEVLVEKPMCHHTAAVTSMAFHPTKDHMLLSGGLDCTLLAWDLAAGTRKMEDATHRGGVTAVAWVSGPGGDDAVSVGGDYCIKRWSV